MLLPYFRMKRRTMTNEDVQLTTSDYDEKILVQSD